MDNRFNLFLNSKSEIEKHFIVNYKKESNQLSLIEYSCNHNLYTWLKILKSYSDIDLLEYYSKSEKINLTVFKLLFRKYKKSYIQNVILYSCNPKVIEYLLYFDNNNNFSFSLLMELGNLKLITLFIKYGYKIQNYEIEMLVMKNIVFIDLFEKIYKWIKMDNKNKFYIFKYCNNIDLIDFLKFN